MVDKKRSIGKFAKQAGLSVQTIRYYENLGILPQPERSESGYRYYDDAYFEHITFIQNAKSLNFTLDEIKELVNLKISKKALGNDIKKIIIAKAEMIEEQINELKKTKEYLLALNSSCSGDMKTNTCPIVKKLSSNS
jgi:Cu(I)-responsive transcriptional regulator